MPRQCAQEPRSAVATLDACHGATPHPAPRHAPGKESLGPVSNGHLRAPKASRVHHFKTLTSYL